MIRTPLFLLLLVFAVPGTSHAGPIIAGLNDAADPTLAGRVLVSELNCASCHSGNVPTKGAPDLQHAASRISPEYLQAFIADPHATKPGTTMPDMLGALSSAERAKAARAIASYLDSLDPAEFKLDPIEPAAVERGRELFHTVGCVACHSPEGKAFGNSPPLHRIEEKYSLASLTAFLEDPLAVRKGGRMPDMRLTHWEAADIAGFLLKDQVPRKISPPPDTLVEEGRKLFESHGCVQCHQPAEAKKDFAKPLAGIDMSKQCGGANFELNATQQARIAAALKTPANDPEAEIRLTLTRLNCIACHQRGDLGGASAERDPYFTTTNLNLGDQARMPPPLTGVGAKLKPAWLRKVLVSGASVRPYMTTRMPVFGTANVEPLIDSFLHADQLPPAEFKRVADERTAREAGRQLLGVKSLGCVACHTFNGESATTLAGVELTSMTERLQEHWFHQYLLSPQSFSASTIMPGFWPGGKSTRPDILGGDTGMQMDAIWQALLQGRDGRTPDGIRREPIPLLATADEAVMLRRQYEGIGKRGIGVGYPAGINLSFDAGQMRLGSIWKGGFGEMSSVWDGQGSGKVHEASREVVRFPVGPAIAHLESADAAWPVVEQAVKAPGFQFRGYTLDHRQRPAFRYTLDDLGVTDAFVDQSEGPALVRTLAFSKPAPQDLYFRVAADAKPGPAGQTDTYQLPKGLLVRTPPGAILHTRGDLTELRLPLGGKTSVTIEYRFDSK